MKNCNSRGPFLPSKLTVDGKLNHENWETQFQNGKNSVFQKFSKCKWREWCTKNKPEFCFLQLVLLTNYRQFSVSWVIVAVTWVTRKQCFINLLWKTH